MKLRFIARLLLLGATILTVRAEEPIKYHFQEGFVSSSPLSWDRKCGSTSTLNRNVESWKGDYSVKFDATYNSPVSYLASSQVKGAGRLSFWVSKNANATYMTLYVAKVVGSDTIQLGSYNAFEFPHKSVSLPEPQSFANITIDIKEPSASLKIIFWAEINQGNAGWFVLDDISLTQYDGPTVEPEALERFSTNFNDNTWGEVAPSSSSYAAGSYPSSTWNGFILNKAFVAAGSMTCPQGQSHVNRIVVDKASYSGYLECPYVKNIGEIEIHALTGSVDMSFRVEELVGSTWSKIGTYNTIKAYDSVYVIPIERPNPTKIRIANNTGSALNIYKVVARSADDVRNLTLVSSNPAEGSVCFHNLTKQIELKFNHDIELNMQGSIFLNQEPIAMSSCLVDGCKLTIPVALSSNQGVNKSYQLSISSGTIVKKIESIVVNQPLVINFQTFRMVALPPNYTAQMDIEYHDANSNNCRMDLYRPIDTDKLTPVVINIHGGGWNHGYKEEQSGFNTFFAMGMAVANIEYRMTAEALAPAAVQDARGALLYLLAHAQELNIDPDKVVYMGGSAGGHLALMGGYLMNDRRFDDLSASYTPQIKIAAVIDKYGPADIKEFMHYSSLVKWLGPNATNPDFVASVSPVNYVNSQTPPTYIIHGDADPTVEYQQSLLLVDALKKAGVKHQFTTVPGGGHGGFPAEYNTQMNNEITQFLTQLLGQLTAIDTPTASGHCWAPIITVEGGKIEVMSASGARKTLYDSTGTLLLSTYDDQIYCSYKGVVILQVESTQSLSSHKIILQ